MEQNLFPANWLSTYLFFPPGTRHMPTLYPDTSHTLPSSSPECHSLQDFLLTDILLTSPHLLQDYSSSSLLLIARQ